MTPIMGLFLRCLLALALLLVMTAMVDAAFAAPPPPAAPSAKLV
ncbi:hypothetical protein [Ramlibacter sp. PS4R-6]